MKRICECGTSFDVARWQINAGRGKYCSKACMYTYRTRPSGLTYEIKVTNSRWFTRGHGPTGGEIKPGERRSIATEFTPGKRASPATEFGSGNVPWNAGTRGVMPSGAAHHQWQGDRVGYDALHDWVHRNKSKPDACESCNEVKPLDAANLSGEYRRDVSDWAYMCRSCHFRHDRQFIPSAKVARWGSR